MSSSVMISKATALEANIRPAASTATVDKKNDLRMSRLLS
jgi:hypothetical protein